MNRLFITCGLFLSTLSVAGELHAECPETPAGNRVYIGLDVTIKTGGWSQPAGHSPELGEELELIFAQLVWIPRQEQERYRNQYLIGIDPVNQSVTNVDVWGGEEQAIIETDINPVDLAGNTDWENGQVALVTCAGLLSASGPVLLFAYYGVDGLIYPWETRVTPMIGEMGVTDSYVSEAVVENYESNLEYTMSEDIDNATGVLPDAYLTQNLMIQNLNPMTNLLQQNPASFFNPENVIIRQNRLYVTGSPASVLVPIPVDSVRHEAGELLRGGKQVRQLETHLGLLEITRADTNFRPGYAVVLDARPDIIFETTECVDNRSRLTARFRYESSLPGEIHLIWADSAAAFEVGEEISKNVHCDREYRLEAFRKGEFGAVVNETQWVRF